jgi:hypothetical protein
MVGKLFIERNRRFPFGDKEAAEGQPHVDSSAGTDITPAGILSMTPRNADPHAGGFKMPVGFEPSARAAPPNDMGPGLLPANGCINSDPHPYGGDVKAPNTYGKLIEKPRR